MGSDLKNKLCRLKWHDLLHCFLFLTALPCSWLYRRQRPSLWLICEYENEARDNAYWLFKYIRENHPEQDVVYAINKNAPDYNKVAHLGECVQYGTFRHWLYYLSAKVNISSQKGGKPSAALCYVLEVWRLRKNCRVFLQHGIIVNDLPYLHYKNSRISLFVCSAERERQFVIERFGYPEHNVCCAGMCRYDSYKNARQNGTILVMPTWRNWFATDHSWNAGERFRESQYYRCWNSFLNNKELERILNDNNLRLIFYPHRNMAPFLRFFAAPNDRITIAPWESQDTARLLRESAMLITDYSSVSMDFAYMGKALLYYQFDLEAFRKGHQPQGYFDYVTDGFGPVCTNESEVIHTVSDSLKNHFQILHTYQKRRSEFFPWNDFENCRRSYKAINTLL